MFNQFAIPICVDIDVINQVFIWRYGAFGPVGTADVEYAESGQEPDPRDNPETNPEVVDPFDDF